MKCDIVLAGVGGQGVLAVAAVIAKAASMDGYNVKQSEVHGMAQRGGSVLSHLRISKKTVHSDLISKGEADIILGMEPLESLRYVDYLSHNGTIVTSMNPVKNITNYPKLENIIDKVDSYSSIVVDDDKIAREAGNGRSKNMVMVGAISRKLPVNNESILSAIESLFKHKGSKIVNINLKAFNLGKFI